MTETPDHTIVRSSGRIEERRYAPYLVAEVDVRADGLREAAEKGFGPLADYIFGNNLPRAEIAMTAPVTASRTGQTIDMTAPVTAAVGADGTYTVTFSMPSEWTMASLPAPNNPQIRLAEVPARSVLAITFRGESDPERMAEAASELLAFAAGSGRAPDGEPRWAGYSAPYVPVPLRRWEMLLGLDEA